MLFLVKSFIREICINTIRLFGNNKNLDACQHLSVRIGKNISISMAGRYYIHEKIRNPHDIKKNKPKIRQIENTSLKVCCRLLFALVERNN